MAFAACWPAPIGAWQTGQVSADDDRHRARCEFAGLEPSEAAMMASHPLAETDELPVRLAWRARKVTQQHLVAAIEAAVPDENGPDLASFRFGVVAVQGELIELHQWLELDGTAEPAFWRATLVASDGTRFIAAVSRVPASLQAAPLPLPDVRVTGYLAGKLEVNPSLNRAKKGTDPDSSGRPGETASVPAEEKETGPDGSASGPWLVCGQRLEWFPKSAPAGLDLAPGLIVLAEAGFDAGLADDIRRAGPRPLTAGEREAWNAFLRATSRLKPAGWESLVATEKPARLADLFRDPQRITGRPVTLVGSIRRVTAIETGENQLPGTRQLELIVDTGGPGVEITNLAGEKMKFGQRVPVTVLAGGHLAEPLREGSSVAIDGLAYRFWSYESGASLEQGAASGQTLPLVMAWRIRPVDSGRETVDFVLNWMTYGLLAAVAAIAATIWWMNRRDRATRP